MRAAFYPKAPCANDPRGAYDRIVPKALSSNVTDVALIFEGGGMRASLTSAVIPSLLTAGIYIDYVTGISAGSTRRTAMLLTCGMRMPSPSTRI